MEEGREIPCVRVKIAPDHKMSAMRDPVIYRYKKSEENGGWFPTYDFSHPIVDYLEEITHSYCTREFFIRRDLYYWFIHAYKQYARLNGEEEHPEPQVYEFNRLEIEGVKLSKRYFLKQIADNEVTGFDDPKLFTLAGLRAKGHRPDAILHFIHNYVSYVAGDGGTIQLLCDFH